MVNAPAGPVNSSMSRPGASFLSSRAEVLPGPAGTPGAALGQPPAPRYPREVMSSTRRQMTRRIYAELAAFGVVGAVCLVADVVLFNALAFGAGLNPVVAKLIGLVITGLMAFFGHRHITFRHRHGGSYGREVSRFLAATATTVFLSLVPLFAARHLAGVTSIVGLNVANVLGIALGTVARYLA